MPSIFSKTVSLLTGDDSSSTDWLKLPARRPLKTLTDRDLISLESEIGATLFGPVAKGRRREFFCLDATTWIWHEEWIDEHRKHQVSTVRYEIQPDDNVLKVSPGARYSYLEGDELKNLTAAIQMYYERVAREIYHVDPDTGQKLD